MKEHLFLVQVWGDVSPETYGPFQNGVERLNKARELHADDEGCVFELNVKVGVAGAVSVEALAYTDDELADNPDDVCDSCGGEIGGDHAEGCENITVS